MSTKASIAIQDLTYTEKQLGLGVTISYSNGGTAGSEVVTVTGHAIDVKIASGTSTAAQIKAAVDASYEAALLVAVEVTGTGSTAQVTCKNALLAGGAAAVKASKRLGAILFTAKSAGTAGNSTRIKFVTASSLAVSVASADITIDIVSGTTKASAVMALIRATGAADALVDVSFAAADAPMLTAYASAFTALTGGAAAVAASIVVQDITFAKDVTGTSGNGDSFSYTTGATAGSEVVSVSGSTVGIQIENGVSTATQIKAAFDAAPLAQGAVATGSIVVNAYAPLHLTKASGDHYLRLADDPSCGHRHCYRRGLHKSFRAGRHAVRRHHVWDA